MGRQIASLPIDQYMQLMGGNVNSASYHQNSGIFFTNFEVWKYFKILRLYALNRIKWTSDQISEEELRLIEWNIFHFGFCAMIKPKIIRNNLKIQFNKPKIYRCAFTEINVRTGYPYKISIVNQNTKGFVIDNNYNSDEFVIFTDEFSPAENVNPFAYVAWEFANKLHDIDLAFNANAHKLRFPFLFSNGGTQTEKDGTVRRIPIIGNSIAETVRSTMGRNEMFAEIPEHMVGNNQFMYEPQYVNNDLINLIDAQKKIYERYFELLGLYTNPEKGGAYTVKRLQESGDETGDYITETLKSTRILCAKRASEMFKINLKVRVLQ